MPTRMDLPSEPRHQRLSSSIASSTVFLISNSSFSRVCTNTSMISSIKPHKQSFPAFLFIFLSKTINLLSAAADKNVTQAKSSTILDLLSLSTRANNSSPSSWMFATSRILRSMSVTTVTPPRSSV